LFEHRRKTGTFLEKSSQNTLTLFPLFPNLLIIPISFIMYGYRGGDRGQDYGISSVTVSSMAMGLLDIRQTALARNS
jgi:hypothetical protein